MEVNRIIRDKVEKGNYINSIGPSTDPWGTSYVTRQGDETVELTNTEEVRLVMNEDRH